jgi:hypothetical protein
MIYAVSYVCFVHKTSGTGICPNCYSHIKDENNTSINNTSIKLYTTPSTVLQKIDDELNVIEYLTINLE